MDKQEFLKIVRASKKHPVFFVENVLGDKLWKKQKQILNEVQHNNVSVASCHGAGKSFTASRVVLHAMAVHPGTQVITTAPTNRQVKKVLWKEIRTGHKRSNFPIGGKVLTQEMQIDDDWFALGFATSDTDSFQGFHGKKVLVVADEAAGVDETIFNGIDGITSGANSRVLHIGNPTSRAGRFYQSHTMADNSFVKFNISVSIINKILVITFIIFNFGIYSLAYSLLISGIIKVLFTFILWKKYININENCN